MLTDQQHPITPPPELVEQWINEPGGLSAVHVATQAARWGADQELEACVEWMRSHFHGVPQWADQLRAARRPKPPSLAEEALTLLDEGPVSELLDCEVATIRAALKRLQQLEKENNDN